MVIIGTSFIGMNGATVHVLCFHVDFKYSFSSCMFLMVDLRFLFGWSQFY